MLVGLVGCAFPGHVTRPLVCVCCQCVESMLSLDWASMPFVHCVVKLLCTCFFPVHMHGTNNECMVQQENAWQMLGGSMTSATSWQIMACSVPQVLYGQLRHIATYVGARSGPGCPSGLPLTGLSARPCDGLPLHKGEAWGGSHNRLPHPLAGSFSWSESSVAWSSPL